MAEIVLSRGLVAIVDDGDFVWLSQWKWFATRRSSAGPIYAARNLPRGTGPRRQVLMHREILRPPEGVPVDHINGDGLFNRRSNLRQASHSQNLANRACPANRTGYRGVYFKGPSQRGAKFRAQIRKEGRRVSLGYFDLAEDAARAWDRAALEIYGPFARLNFPGEAA